MIRKRIRERGFPANDIASTKSINNIKIQADRAKIYIKELSPGKFNVIVEGKQGIITGLKNIDQADLNNLAKIMGGSEKVK